MANAVPAVSAPITPRLAGNSRSGDPPRRLRRCRVSGPERTHGRLVVPSTGADRIGHRRAHRAMVSGRVSRPVTCDTGGTSGVPQATSELNEPVARSVRTSRFRSIMQHRNTPEHAPEHPRPPKFRSRTQARTVGRAPGPARSLLIGSSWPGGQVDRGEGSVGTGGKPLRPPLRSRRMAAAPSARISCPSP